MMDGYMAEINFVEGYAYGPEYFGEFNSSNIWIPKLYGGTYGTNGFYITGETDSDLGANKASSNTFATYASSGMGTHDKVLDSPTNNFVTLNPFAPYNSAALSNDGLFMSAPKYLLPKKSF